MRKIYTSLDIGTDSIKVLVCEMYNNKENVLSVITQKSRGIKKGLIVNAEDAARSIKEAIKKTEETLGIKIEKVIATVPANNAMFYLVDGYSTVTNEEKKVTGDDMVRAMQASVYNKVKDDSELVAIMPIEFNIDEKNPIKDPKGLKGNKLSVRAVMATVPRKNALSVVTLLETLGISVIDITLSSIADYEALKDDETDVNLGAIVNIGCETTTVSVVNKGILINNKVLQFGGKNIDSDISYVYHVSKEASKKMKETFAVCHKRYSSVDEVYEIVNDDNNELRINQYEISEVAYYRLIDILKIVKKEINILTNKEISYIMFTGGTSEMIGFKAVAEEVFPCSIILKEPKTIGIRNNKYGSSIGMITYFNKKLQLKRKDFSMFTDDEVEEIVSTKKQVLNINNDSVIGKLLGYFFDN